MSSPWSPDTYLDAYHYAARVHLGQRYTGTEISYIMHLSFVSMEVISVLGVESGHDGNLAVMCALLHDTIEDTDESYESIRDRFGVAVADGVLALTKDASLPKSARMADSLRRISLQPPEVGLVKMSDRTTNLQPPPAAWPSDKRAKYQAEAREIHAVLASCSVLGAQRLAEKIEAYGVYV